VQSSAPDDRAGLAFSRLKGKDWSGWVADADGSHARAVTRGVAAGLSPDGRLLTYKDPNDEEGRLFLRDLGNGKTHDLGPALPLAWSPDGRTLAISNREQLLLVDTDQAKQRELARGEIWSASFSPDGKALVFPKENGLFIAHLAEDRVSRLTEGRLAVWGRSWIAFNRYRFLGADYGPVSDLYLIRPDGSDLHRLTIDGESGYGSDHYLRYGLVPKGFSADGIHLLACVSIELGSCEIVTFSLPKASGRKLTRAADEGAVWKAILSLDGSEVLFEDGALDDEEHHSIFTMPVEGGKRTLLIRNATDPFWASAIPPKRGDSG